MADKPPMQSPVRHGLKAFAVFTIMLFLLGGSAGLATAANQEEQAIVEHHELVFPAHTVGERTSHSIEYESRSHGREHYLTVELVDREPFRYPDGSLRDTFAADLYWGHDEQDRAGHQMLDPTTMRVIADAGEVSENDTRAKFASYRYGWGDPTIERALQMPSCLHANIFLDDDGTMSAEGPIGCALPGSYGFFANSLGPSLVEWTRLDGEEAFHIQIVDEDDATDVIDLWYVSGIPSAVRVEYEWSGGSNDSTGAILRLEEFVAGDPSLPLVANIRENALPPIGSYSMQGHWPDDSDFDVPFRLVDAMAVAMQWPGSGLPEFIEENPDAYTYAFWFFTSRQDERVDRYWSVNLRGEEQSDGLSVWVTQSTKLNDASGNLTESAPVYSVNTEAGKVQAITPDPKHRPEGIMAFQDATLWADTFTSGWYGDGGEPMLYGVMYCLQIDCKQPRTLMTVGEMDLEFSSVPALPLPLPGTDDFGKFEFSGDMLMLVDRHPIYAGSWWHGEKYTIEISPPEKEPSISETESSSITVASLTWTPPPPAVTGASIGAAILSGLAYYFWPFLKQGVFAGLFSRLQRPALLEHPARSAIHDAIHAEPGIRFSVLGEQTGLANGTLRHHLHMLVDAGLVSRREEGGFTCYFVPADVTPENTALAGSVQSEGARTVLDYIRTHPGTTARSVADGTGLAVGTVGYHVKRLRDAGVIASERDGRQVRLTTA